MSKFMPITDPSFISIVTFYYNIGCNTFINFFYLLPLYKDLFTVHGLFMCHFVVSSLYVFINVFNFIIF